MTQTRAAFNQESDTREKSLHYEILGGNNRYRIGMNSGLCTYQDGTGASRRLLFDIGTLFNDSKSPEDPALAPCDLVIPDMARFFAKDGAPPPAEPVDAIFLTHSHSDHIGAIPLLMLLGYQMPRIYCTPYTACRLQQELADEGIDPSRWPQILTIAPGAPVKEGAVTVTGFSVSHSTPQSVGYFIETPEGNILLPGDIKLDQTVVWGPAFSEEQFGGIIAGKGVDMMVMDSTGADRDVQPVTEEDVRRTLASFKKKYPDKRFIVAVMSGFEENMASVAKVAGDHGCTLWVSGGSHEQALAALSQTGLDLASAIGTPVDVRMLTGAKAIRDLAEQDPSQAMVVVTGAQGHAGAALTRAADGRHPGLALNPDTDIIFFCAPSIPGQEGTRARLLASLKAQGYTVFTRAEAPLYSQAHARLGEILAFADMAGAKTVIPAHGDAPLRQTCATALAVAGHNTLMAENGARVRVTRDGCTAEALPEGRRVPLTGFRRLQTANGNWSDHDYAVMHLPAETGDREAPPPANQNGKRPPNIYTFN